MIVYSIIMFAAAIAFGVFAILISRGYTNVINCYHEEKVADKPAYCRKLSQSLWLMASVLTVSGVLGLIGKTDTVAVAAVCELTAGLVCGLCRLFYVQKKYGGGVF